MRKIGLILMLICGSGLAAVPTNARPPGVTGATWQFGPLNRWAYVHLREILPTKNIPNRAGVVSVIPGIAEAPNALSITLNGSSVQLTEAMEHLFVDGILVIKDGTAVVERYAGHLAPEKTHLLWSVSKTITGLTAATIAHEGLIDLEKTVSHYVPELASTGWASTT
ncbi:uncharacterized protein METZ01_LOCUS397591, partial [marine metagenome]